MTNASRGEVWLVDLGMTAKVRPAVILSVRVRDDERAVFALVPHTTALAPDLLVCQILASVRRVIQPLVVFPAFYGVIETPTLVVLDESEIPPARGARAFGKCEPVTHGR